MHATVPILCAMLVGSFGAPKEYGIVFSSGGESETEVSGGLGVKVDNGKLSTDVIGSAASDFKSQINGGVYRESNGKVVGVNGGIHGKIGGAINKKVHGEIGRNKDGSISAGANSTIITTSHTGLGGHANLATGDAERRHIAELEGKAYQSNSSQDPGTETDLVPLISIVGNIIDNFWLYFWLAIGGIILITCCCLFTVCGFYWKLVGDVKSLKTDMTDKEKGIKETKPAFGKNSEELVNNWDTEY